MTVYYYDDVNHTQSYYYSLTKEQKARIIV